MEYFACFKRVNIIYLTYQTLNILLVSKYLILFQKCNCYITHLINMEYFACFKSVNIIYLTYQTLSILLVSKV